MKKLLAMALCLVAVSGYAQKGKEKIAADFYGVDYSCVNVKGADEEPGAFIKAFEAINRLFLSEPKKYDVAGFTGIDILSTGVEQANESLGALAAEQFTPRSAATDWQTQLPQIVVGIQPPSALGQLTGTQDAPGVVVLHRPHRDAAQLGQLSRGVFGHSVSPPYRG
jgi:hypothetical protein